MQADRQNHPLPKRDTGSDRSRRAIAGSVIQAE
jgi:hypothetical protein